MRPRLLVLDDFEGRIAGALDMAWLRELAEVTVLDRPLADGDLDRLTGVRVLLAIRERTCSTRPCWSGCPSWSWCCRRAATPTTSTSRRRPPVVVVALSRRARMASASVPELTFGLALAALRRIHPLAAEPAVRAWPAAMGGTLAGRTLGVLGLGRHGRPVARIAAAFAVLVLGLGPRSWPRVPWTTSRSPSGRPSTTCWPAPMRSYPPAVARVHRC